MKHSKSQYNLSSIGFFRNLLILLIGLTVIACTQKHQNSDALNNQKDEIQQTIKKCKDIQELETLLQSYIQEKNIQAEMLTRMELGKQYRESSMFKEAIDNHNSALTIALNLNDTVEIIQISNQLGTNFRRIGSNDRGAEYHYQALTYCETFSDQSSDMAKKNKVVSLNGLGNSYLSLNNLEMAESAFKQALQGEKELNSDLGQAINYANIGAIKEMQNKLDSAMTYYRTSLEYNLKANSDLGIALCYNHLGEVAEKQKQWDKAINSFERSYEIMEGDKDRWHWLESCIDLARIHLQINNISTAQKYLKTGIETATNIGDKEHLSTLLLLKSQYEEKRGNINQALSDYKQSVALADSTNNSLIKANIQSLRIKYEREKKEKEISFIRQTYEKEQRAKKAILYTSISALLTTIIIIALLAYSVRLKSRSQKIMREMEKTREAFFTNITHEFRTPLTLILGIGKQIENGQVQETEQLKSSGNIIVRQGNNLLHLINQLLDISKIKSAIGEPNWRTDNIVPFIHMIIENLHELAQQKRIELTYQSEQNSILIDFVPDYLQKIIQNLVANSIKFTNQYGKIMVYTAIQKDQLLLKVEDTGVGIPKNMIGHIFEPFFQSKDDTANIGTGIGLSLVNQIVQALEGTINVESELQKGTIFTITLPTKHGEGNWASLSSDKKEITNSDNITRILIVEDNTDIAYYIGSMFKYNYQVFYARNGADGLLKANELVPDLIITDIMMPEKDGYELCEEIRRSDLLNHIPIIIISARTTEEERIKGIKAGANAYLYKPFNADELKTLAAQLMEQKNTLRKKYSQSLDENSRSNEKLAPSDQEFINKLNDLIHAQMKTGDLNAENIASIMCMSRSQLNRKLMAIAGQNITNYSLQLRIAKAKRMLDADINTPIGEIANACGFEDVSYFSRVFKQMCQMTPSQYRKRV